MKTKSLIQQYTTVFFIVVLLSACSSAFYTPTPDMAKENVPLENLVQGKSLYMNKCGSCHRLHTPDEFSADKWRHYVDDMQERAQVNDPEKEKIYQYLINAPKKK